MASGARVAGTARQHAGTPTAAEDTSPGFAGKQGAPWISFPCEAYKTSCLCEWPGQTSDAFMEYFDVTIGRLQDVEGPTTLALVLLLVIGLFPAVALLGFELRRKRYRKAHRGQVETVRGLSTSIRRASVGSETLTNVETTLAASRAAAVDLRLQVARVALLCST